MSAEGFDPSPDIADLRARLATLEAENASLRTDAAPAPVKGGRRSAVWRSILSAVCIVLASIIVPVSVVGAWARVQLVDESAFVQTFGPLASDGAVQGLLIDQVSAAIDERVDLAGITDSVFDGIESLGLPSRAASALDLLRTPAAQGLQSILRQSVTRVVQSDAFAGAWQTALQSSHRALVAAATGGTAGGGVSISDAGEVGIQLGPIIDQVKASLVDQGVGFAARIPTIDRTIVVAQSNALVTVRIVYTLAATVGWWLPVIALALFVLGILLARRRTAALLGSGIGLAIGGTVLAVGLAIGGTVLQLSAAQLGVTSSALAAIYAQLVGGMSTTAVVLAVIGGVLAVLGWATGRSRAAATLRGALGSVNARLRTALAEAGADTGGFGRWMRAQRVLVRTALAVLLVVWLMLLRPLSVGDVALVLIVGLLLWWAAELVQWRPEEHSTTPDAETATATQTETEIEPEPEPEPEHI